MFETRDWRVSLKGGTEYALVQATGADEAYQVACDRLGGPSRTDVEVQCLSPVYCPECGAEARPLPPGEDEFIIVVLLYRCDDDGCSYRDVIPV